MIFPFLPFEGGSPRVNQPLGLRVGRLVCPAVSLLAITLN